MSENVPGLCVCDVQQQSFIMNNVCRTCTGVGNLVEEGGDYKCVCGNNALIYSLASIIAGLSYLSEITGKIDSVQFSCSKVSRANSIVPGHVK